MNSALPQSILPIASGDRKPKTGIRFQAMRGLLTGVALSTALWVPIGLVASRLF